MYLQENDLKRARALKKTKAEQELARQKDKEVDRLAQEIEELTEVVAQQKADLTRYKIYQKFMERALDKSDEVNTCKYNDPRSHSEISFNQCSLMKLMRLLLDMILSSTQER